MGQPLHRSATGPALGCIAITPADSGELANWIRAVTLNASGTLSYVGWDDATYTTNTLPAGTYPLLAKQIRATGTSPTTGITGWI